MFPLWQLVFRVSAWWRFYLNAVTKYQVHSPFIFNWITEVLEDERYYYSFDDIQALRQKMLYNDVPILLTDYGTGPDGIYDAHAEPVQRSSSLRKVVQRSGSDSRQGELLFRLVLWLRPKVILELGASVGLSTLYLSRAAGSQSKVVALEGCPQSAAIARLNLETLKVAQAQVITGAFETTLEGTLNTLSTLDLVYFDGNHQREATLRYFEQCIAKAGDETIFVFDDIHWSEGMEAAWATIQQYERVTLTIDCGYFACVFFRPEFKEKQHFKIVASEWKPWKVF